MGKTFSLNNTNYLFKEKAVAISSIGYFYKTLFKYSAPRPEIMTETLASTFL